MYPAHNLKRKREDYDDDSDEEPFYGKQILPVANLPANFDDEPVDGMQYLFTVRRDARRLPEITRVPNPYEVLEPPLEATPNSGMLATHPAMPSEEWCTLLERRFRNLRQNFNQPTIHVGPTHEPNRRFMPEKKERDLWWVFLEGKPEKEWHTSKKSQKQNAKKRIGMRGWVEEPAQEQCSDSYLNNDEGEVEQVLRVDPAELLPTPSGTPVPSERRGEFSGIQAGSSTIPSEAGAYSPREPSTTVLKLIDERTALHLLMYFTHWINSYTQGSDLSASPPKAHHARWIFTLLCRVDDYISADDMNLLRNLARACSALLKSFAEKRLNSSPASPSSVDTEQGNMSENSCWIIISIIVHVWKQRDLWMDMEDILRRLGPRES